MMNGTLLDIALKKRSRAPMERYETVTISPDTGLEGDLRGGVRNRNVTVVSREAWNEACTELGQDPPWTTRRGNLLVEGIDLEETEGSLLRVGPVVLEITGECQPCERMDEQVPGLRAALTPRWRAGVQCRVIEGGEVRLGDRVTLEPRYDRS